MPDKTQSPPPPPQPALREEFRNPANDRVMRDYFFDVDKQYRSINVLSLRPGQDDRPDHILDAFVAPGGAERRYGPEEIDRLEAEGKETPGPLLSLLVERPRAVVLGDPGSGKSTLTAWLATALAGVRSAGLPPEFFWMVPVPVILKDIAPTLFKDGCRDLSWDDLYHAFLQRDVAKVLRDHHEDFTAWCESGQVFFLIDGFDEVSDPDKRRALRDAIWDGMGKHQRCRWLLTSRIVGYDESVVDCAVQGRPISGEARSSFPKEPNHELSLAELLARPYGPSPFRAKFLDGTPDKEWTWHKIADRLYVTPFDDARMKRFLDVWMPARVGEAQGPEKARDLWGRFQRTPEARVIARVPIVLVFAGQVYIYYGNLPQGRTRLYDRITEAYSGTIVVSKGFDLRYSAEEIQKLLARVGWELQCLRGNEKEETRGKPVVKRDPYEEDKEAREDSSGDGMVATRAMLEQWLRGEVERSGTDQGQAALDDFIRYVTRITGLLLPRGEDHFGFTHLSFQEYYAALYLEQWFGRCVAAGSRKMVPVGARWEDFDGTIRPLAERQDWQEVMVFLAERLSYQPGQDYPVLLLERLGLTDPQPPKVLMRKWEDFKKDPDSDPDPLAVGLAELGARWSVNPFVHLTPDDRLRLWHRLWRWQYWWSQRSWAGYRQGNGLAPLVLNGTPHSNTALEALATAIDPTSMRGADTLVLLKTPSLSDVSPLASLTGLRLLALGGCTGLTRVDHLPSSLTELGLESCTGLTEVDRLPRALVRVSLNNCTDLSSVDHLPSSLKRLYLNGCTGLTQVDHLPPSLTELDLNGCTGLTEVDKLPRSVTWLWLTGCTALTALNSLPPAVTNLYLNGCTGLTSLDRLPPSVVVLNLAGCTRLRPADVQKLRASKKWRNFIEP